MLFIYFKNKLLFMHRIFEDKRNYSFFEKNKANKLLILYIFITYIGYFFVGAKFKI